MTRERPPSFRRVCHSYYMQAARSTHARTSHTLIAHAPAHRSEWFGLRADSRPAEQRVAERYLKGSGPREWADACVGSSMPRASLPVGYGPPSSCSTMLLFCPGLINGLLPVRAFNPAMANIEAVTGIRVLRAPLHPLRGAVANVEDVLKALEKGEGLHADLSPSKPAEPPPLPERVVVVCYSKGMTDFLRQRRGARTCGAQAHALTR